MNYRENMKKELKSTSTKIGISLLICELLIYPVSFLMSNILRIQNSYIQKLLEFISTTEGFTIYGIILTTSIEIITIILLTKLLKIKPREYIKKPTNWTQITVNCTLWAMSISFFVSIINGILQQIFTSQTGLEPIAPDTSLPQSQNPTLILIIYFIRISVLAPVFEEVIFRGIILNSLKKYGSVFAIVTTSLLFGLWHGNFSQAVPICVSSIMLSIVALKTNSIIPTIIMHYINNTFSLIFDKISQVYGDNISNSIFYITMTTIIILGFILYLKDKNTIKIKSSSFKNNISTKEKIRSFVLSKGMIMFEIYLIYNYITLFKRV